MTARLVHLTFDAHDPEALADFWGRLLGWSHEDARTLRPDDDTGFSLRFEHTEEPRWGPNKIHFDLTSNLSPQAETVRRALDLGARHIDVGQTPEEGHTVLADPDDNEFCVIPEGNGFLADCGFIGALSCDGSQQVGYFWSDVLGWPLVWDQDEETAIRSPHGGPKIAWGGPPLDPKLGRNRVHLDIAAADGDRDAMLARLLELGAHRLGAAPGGLWMSDPDGNEFRLLDA